MGRPPGPPQLRVLQPVDSAATVAHPAVHLLGEASCCLEEMVGEGTPGILELTRLASVLVQIFYLPLALVAPPTLFAVHIQLNLLYQFWIHTEVNKWIQWVDPPHPVWKARVL